MAERLAEIEARIGSVRQLSGVISAMRGLAAVRSAEATRHVESARAYAATIAAAIAEVLPTAPEVSSRPSPDQPKGRRTVAVALCAEQGFAGSFSRKVLERVKHDIAASATALELFVIGDRGIPVAGELGLPVAWSIPAISAHEQATSSANMVMDRLYESLRQGEDVRVAVVFAVPAESLDMNIVVRQLIPFDMERFSPAASARAPLMHIERQRLLSLLAEEYVFAELCEAILLSFAAENAARVRATVAAQENVEDTLEALTGRARRQRQEETTNEIVELSTGALLR